jgi:hypothetical protein
MTTDELTTTTQEHGPTLTPDQITALRTGTAYVVDLEDGKATLRVRRDLPAPSGFKTPYSDGPQAETTFDVGADSTVSACFVMLYTPPSMRALAHIVRPGDVLRFHARVNNNGYLSAASIPPGAMEERYHAGGYPKLFAEELVVTILRPNPKTGKVRTLVRDWLLAYTIVPDNTARNIRPRANARQGGR